MDTNDEWIRTRTGIGNAGSPPERERAIWRREAAEPGACGSRSCPGRAGYHHCGTSSPDRNYPSDACSVQAAIGAVNAVAFDISAACAGFIFAMNIVEGFFKAGIYKTALIIGA